LEKFIYFITGASGVGKTTLVNHLQKKYKDNSWEFLHFDKIGVPSVEEMIREFGSPSAWQESKTSEWIKRLIHDYTGEKIFFEGQVNLQFIRNGFAKHHFNNYRTILIDCSETVMEKRLVHDRKQGELYTQDMRNWLKFLRNQANEFNVAIIDSSGLSEKELRIRFEETIELNSGS
jgi:GTPase SAR1 family protein